MAGADGIEQCLKMLKLTPVDDLEKNVFFLSNFVDQDDLMARVDLPLGVATDTKVNQQFLTCDYNRDEDSFRSPFSNEYFPPLEEEDEPTFPPAHLRALEKFANEMFGYYVRLYYGKAAPCSVYCFDIDGTAFGSCWVVKKTLDDDDTLSGCVWDCKHIFEVRPGADGNTVYKLQTNVLVSVNVASSSTGNMETRAHSQQTHSVSGVAKTDAQHVRHMGGLVESAEAYARNMLETYLSKMKMVVNRVRDDSGRADVDKGAERRQDLAQFMKRQMKN